MRREEKEKLETVMREKKPDEVIYKVLKVKKKSGWSQLFGMFVDLLMVFFDEVPSNTAGILNKEFLYLIASEKSGKIVEVTNGEISGTIEVPGWTSDKKMKFKKVRIGDYIYKKKKIIKQ